MHQHLIAALALALPLAPLAAQLQWERPNGPLQLTARFGTPLAHDIGRSRTVLFGGYDWNRYHDETWEWDGAVWTERFPAMRPPRRSDHGLAYDQARNRVVLFGGTGQGSVVLDDTWEWDGTNWVQRFTLLRPSPRLGMAMTYDFARARSIVFGGVLAALGPAAPDPHWEWDGTTWTAGPPGPGPRRAPGLAHDWLRNRTVLFGGMGTCLPFSCPTFADTWEFDGSVWTQRQVTGPQARHAAATTFDPVRGRVLLIGGESNCMPACTATFNDAWEWDGALWSLRSTAGPPVHGAGLAYDYGHTTAVEFGGLVAVPAYASTPDPTTRGFDGTNWTVLAAPAMPPFALCGQVRRLPQK